MIVNDLWNRLLCRWIIRELRKQCFQVSLFSLLSSLGVWASSSCERWQNVESTAAWSLSLLMLRGDSSGAAVSGRNVMLLCIIYSLLRLWSWHCEDPEGLTSPGWMSVDSSELRSPCRFSFHIPQQRTTELGSRTSSESTMNQSLPVCFIYSMRLGSCWSY